MVQIVKGKTLVDGDGSGLILATRQNISFWGGVAPETGRIVDPRHEHFNRTIAGKVLVFPYGKGSAAAPLVLLELSRQGTLPAAIVNIEADPLLVAGPIISKHFYNRTIPLILVSTAAFDRFKTGAFARVNGSGQEIRIRP